MHDSTSPTVSLSIGIPSNGTRIAPWTPLTLSSNDAGSGVSSTKYRIWNGTAWSSWATYSNAFNLSAVSNGTNAYLEAYSSDQFNQQSSHLNSSFIVDDTLNAPISWLTAVYPSHVAPGGFTYVTTGSQLNFTLQNASSLQIRVWDGTWSSWSTVSSSHTLPALSDGTIYVEWYAFNGSLTENVHNHSFQFDATSPTVTLSIGTPSNGTRIAPWTPLTLSASDSGSGIDVT